MYQIARAGPNRDLGCWNTQCSMCSSFPTQRREAGLVHASLRVHNSVPPPPQRKEQPRVGLYLPPHSDTPALLSHPAVYTRDATALPTLQMEGPKWAIAHSFFQIFLKVRSFLQLVIS